MNRPATLTRLLIRWDAATGAELYVRAVDLGARHERRRILEAASRVLRPTEVELLRAAVEGKR